MLKDTLVEIFERDLNKLREEINLYESEEDLWKVAGEIKNSGGNLCLHLLGNLNLFIGATLGGTGYVRDRELEFSSKNVARDELSARIDQTVEAVRIGLNNLSPADFEKDFPIENRGEIDRMDFMLVHLFGHFSYHLGQINYHRRLITLV
ncbi:MAG TPA: DUF1572 family protein [Pyrinomonadaceae bacterium]|jgi:uncharacterized damage-inducible protein DinB